MKHRKFWFGSAIVLTLVSIGAAFAKPFNFENILFRVNASTVTGATITFEKENARSSGTTNTTASNARDGGKLILKTFDNDVNKSFQQIGAMVSGSTMRFYESDGTTEFTFQDLDKIAIYKVAESNSTFSFTLHALYTDGTVFSGAYTINALSDLKSLSFTSSGYKDVSNIWIECTNAASIVSRITKVVITYNCSTKYQTGITVSAAPTKTVYEEGQLFDPTGMIVKARYSDDSYVATNSYTYSPSGPLHLSDIQIAIYFHGFVVYQPITVNSLPELVSIYVSTSPTKTAYKVGDYFDPTGMVIKGVFSDYSERELLEYSYSPDRALIATDTQITISATVGETTKQTTQNITVEETTLAGTYIYTSYPSTYQIILNSDFTGCYYFDNDSYSLHATMHFIWSASGTTITFTKDAKSGDSLIDRGSSYNLFTISGSYNTSNSGVIYTSGNIGIYRCSNTSRDGSAKSFVKQ